jgi:hypothetical protein
MTLSQAACISQLREEGFAIAVFSPEEISGVDARELEENMVRDASETIDILRPADPAEA